MNGLIRITCLVVSKHLLTRFKDGLMVQFPPVFAATGLQQVHSKETIYPLITVMYHFEKHIHALRQTSRGKALFAFELLLHTVAIIMATARKPSRISIVSRVLGSTSHWRAGKGALPITQKHLISTVQGSTCELVRQSNTLETNLRQWRINMT